MSREAWRQLGGFDENFRLYFEETDFMKRAERAGLRSVKLPQARAVHLFNQSCQHQPSRGSWYHQSERRFRGIHYPKWVQALFWLLERLPEKPACQAKVIASPTPCLSVLEPPLVLELSNSVVGFPFAQTKIESKNWRFPPRVWKRRSPGRYYLRLVDEKGRELALYQLDKA